MPSIENKNVWSAHSSSLEKALTLYKAQTNQSKAKEREQRNKNEIKGLIFIIRNWL